MTNTMPILTPRFIPTCTDELMHGLRRLAEQYHLPVELHSFINQVKQQYTEELTELKCRPMFHHEYALSKLRAEGYKIAVCSNSIRFTIENMMRKAALSQYLDLIVSNEDVKKAKPDPEMYNTAISKFQLDPKECLIIEDNPNGIAAARASGAYVLPVATVYDVNYENIKAAIRKSEAEND